MKKRIPKIEKAVEALDLPRELVLGIPYLTVLGDREARLENYSGVAEYTETGISVCTSIGISEIRGEGLSIKAITGEDVTICGRVTGFDLK